MQPESGNTVQPDGQWQFTPEQNKPAPPPSPSPIPGQPAAPQVTIVAQPVATPEPPAAVLPEQPAVVAAAIPESQEEIDGALSWSASEFVAYQKSGGWYVSLFIAVLALAALIFLVTRDLISTVTTIIIGILFMIFAARKPRVLTYAISDDGVQIGDKLYPFASMRSFAVIDEGSLRSISLLPMQRFMPAISMYYEPQNEAKIVDALGGVLPQEERKQEIIDKFMHKIRF